MNGYGECLGERIERQDQRDRDESERDKQHDGLWGGDRAAGQWSVLRARYLAVEVPVCEIVDDTPGRAHDDHADDEHEKNVWIRMSVAGDPQSPEHWPQQQPDTDWFIEAHQHCVLLSLVGQFGRQRVVRVLRVGRHAEIILCRSGRPRRSSA
jgi:hypothetical protein